MAKVKTALDVKAFIDALGEEKRRALGLARQAVYKYAGKVMSDALVLVPVDTGFLAASHYINLPNWAGGVVTCEIGFNANYAAAVHERLDQTHKSPTRAKFLEIAMRANAAGFYEFVVGEIKAGLGGKGS